MQSRQGCHLTVNRVVFLIKTRPNTMGLTNAPQMWATTVYLAWPFLPPWLEACGTRILENNCVHLFGLSSQALYNQERATYSRCPLPVIM